MRSHIELVPLMVKQYMCERVFQVMGCFNYHRVNCSVLWGAYLLCHALHWDGLLHRSSPSFYHQKRQLFA